VATEAGQVANGNADAGVARVALVDRLLAGDRVAFLVLGRIMTQVLAHLRAYDFRDACEDLRSEVIAAIVANARAGRLRDTRALTAYVRILTRIKAIARLKDRLHHAPHATLPWETVVAAPPVLAPAAVWDAAGDLPDRQRAVLEAVFREGKSLEEVGKEHGLRPAAIRRRLREALSALRGRLVPEVS